MAGTPSSSPIVLVISSKTDGHVTPVADVLNSCNVNWVRLNTEDLAENVRVVIDPSTTDGFLELRDSGKRITLSAIRVVWYRKPDPVKVDHFQLERAGLEYVEAEFREVLEGIYSLLNGPAVFWINNPFTSRLSHRKLLQLKTATELGMQTPKSLLTNDFKEALEFAEGVRWDLALKSLGSLSVTSHEVNVDKIYGIFTRRVNESEFRGVVEKIIYMPTLLQEYVDKDFELRITCVGDAVFACAIYTQECANSREDSRFNISNLRHEMCQVPTLVPLLRKYMERFGLQFGCFDFAVTRAGDYVFFECNPNGQYLWIEKLTGAPISAAIANMIASHAITSEPVLC